MTQLTGIVDRHRGRPVVMEAVDHRGPVVEVAIILGGEDALVPSGVVVIERNRVGERSIRGREQGVLHGEDGVEG